MNTDLQLLAELDNRVRRTRKAVGISQEELVHRVGMHRTYASSVECGERNISVLNLVSLASALEVDPGGFITGLAREPRHVQK